MIFVVLSDLPPHWVVQFSELELVKKLGRGSFGVVYQAKWRKRDCALKQLLSTTMTTEQILEFKKEAYIMMYVYNICNTTKIQVDETSSKCASDFWCCD